MNAINSSTESYPVKENIEHLHLQSLGWLGQMALLKNENKVLKDLVKSEMLDQDQSENISGIHKMLVGINEKDFEIFDKEISFHERLLASLLLDGNDNGLDYQQLHAQLAVRFNKLKEQMKCLKRSVLESMRMENKTLLVT